MITINSSLTQCTAGADQMCTAVCAISCQLSIVHTVTHSAISKQQTYATLNTLYHKKQQLCTTFICTEEQWKVILTACCLYPADSQHSHCSCSPTKTLTTAYYTKVQHLCHHHVSSSSLCRCCTEQFVISKIYSVLIKEGTCMFIIFLFQCL